MVTAACLVDRGHSILGVEVDVEKLEKLHRGQSPVMENGLDDLVRKGFCSGRMQVSTDGACAVRESDMAIVCIGTPSRVDGSQDTTSIQHVAAEIGAALKDRRERYTVIIRSTLVPGTASGSLIPILERESGKKADRDFDVCVYPEFMREGTSIHDFNNPPLMIVGVRCPEAASPVLELNKHMDAPCFITSIDTAEMVKCTCNAFHALKIAFANEIGTLCKSIDIDGREVMEILCADRNLNISPAYLKPAYAFGGSCLPKDLKALEFHAVQLGRDLPLLQSIIPSNDRHIERAAQLVMDMGCRSIGILGLSFKRGSDDLRESPLVILAKSLFDNRLDVRIFDEDVQPNDLLGANRSFIADRFPEISQRIVPSIEELVAGSELIVVGKLSPASLEYLQHNLRIDQCVVDLIGISERNIRERSNYRGVCW
jgi:GDP-mannose 6-dehydrogenase